jgi:hypothetical protein
MTSVVETPIRLQSIETELEFQVVARCRDDEEVNFVLMHRLRQAGAPVLGWFRPMLEYGILTRLPVLGPVLRWRWTNERSPTPAR